MTGRTFEIVRGTVLLVIAVGFIGWVFIRCLKRSDDPAALGVPYKRNRGDS